MRVAEDSVDTILRRGDVWLHAGGKVAGNPEAGMQTRPGAYGRIPNGTRATPHRSSVRRPHCVLLRNARHRRDVRGAACTDAVVSPEHHCERTRANSNESAP